MITARRLMAVVVDVLMTRCAGGAAEQGHAVSGSDAIAAPIRLWGALTMLVLADLAFTASGCQYLSFVNDAYW